MMKCHDKCMMVLPYSNMLWPTKLERSLHQWFRTGTCEHPRHQERFHKIHRPGSTLDLLKEHLQVQGSILSLLPFRKERGCHGSNQAGEGLIREYFKANC